MIYDSVSYTKGMVRSQIKHTKHALCTVSTKYPPVCGQSGINSR